MATFRLALPLLVATCWVPALLAEVTPSTSTNDLADVLEGFDDDMERVTEDRTEPPGLSAIRELDGSVRLSTAYGYAQGRPAEGGTDFRGFSRLRGHLEIGRDVNLPFEWKGRIRGHGFYDAIYCLRGRDEYTDELLGENEDEAELDEAYLRGSLTDSLDAKVGRQIVAWGKSDNIRVTDVLNPIDRRAPGMVDIEHLRLPVGMTRLDYYFGTWNLTAAFIHEVRFSKRPAFGSDFFSSASRQPAEEEPATTLDNTQYAAALSGVVGKWDVAVYGADIFDDRPHVQEEPVRFEPVRLHERIRMAGAAACVAAGNWLLKTEAACFDGLRYSGDPDRSKTRYDVLAGVEYRGIPDTVISLEAANRHIAGFVQEMRNKPDRALENELQTALRVTRDCWHDTLRLRYLVKLFGTDAGDGGFQRFWAEYDVTDVVKLTGGIVDYRSGDMPPYDTIGDNDRVFVELR